MNLIRLDGWWIGPRNLRVCGRYGANVSGVSAAPFLLELGEFANLTVIGSVAPSGIVPFSFWIARSASTRWSNRINPTPLERPTENNFCIFSANIWLWGDMSQKPLLSIQLLDNDSGNFFHCIWSHHSMA